MMQRCVRDRRGWKLLAIALMVICDFGVIRFALAADRSPHPSITLPCTVVEVTDGDTVVVNVRMAASVRLKDCWAKELHSGGGPAKERLTQLAKGKDATLSIDLSGVRRLGDVFSFGRVVGTLWIDGDCVNRQMIDEGYATETKP